MCFLEGVRQGGHGDAYGYQPVVGVGDEGDHAQVEDGQVHFDVLVYLPLRQGGIAVQGGEGFVDEFEDGLAVVACDFLA